MNEEYTTVKRLLTVIAALAVIGIPIVGRADDSTNRLPTNTDFSQGGFYQYGSGTHSIPGWDIRYDGPNGFGLYPGKYYAIPYSSDVVDLDYGGQISTAADSRASVTAGRVYKFTLDVQHTDGFTYEVKGATPSIQFFDAGGNLLQNIPSMDVQNADPSLFGVQTFGWETGSTTALTQAGAVSASVSAYGPRGGYPNDYSCKWHMTNFRLTTVSETRDHATIRRALRALEKGKPAPIRVHYTTKQSDTILIHLLLGNTLITQMSRRGVACSTSRP